MRATSRFLPILLIWTLGCGRAPADGASSAGVATTIDSTADTVVARVDGEVPPAAIRTLAEEVRIAPSVDDTSLFTNATDVRVDRARRVWVFDSPTSSLFLFGADGKPLRRISRKGKGPGEIEENGGMAALADSGLAVWDPGNSRITFFDATGAFRTGWPVASSLVPYQSAFADRTGKLYLGRAVDERDRVIRALEQLVGELPRETLVGPNVSGGVDDSLVPLIPTVEPLRYVARNRGIRASYYAPNAPVGLWALHPEGFTVVGHGGKYELTIARPGRKPVVIRRTVAPTAISTDEQAEDRDRITYALRMTDPAWTWSGPPLPTTKPPLIGLAVGRDGRIWAQVATPSERIPDADLATPRDPKAPVKHFRTPVAYDVFRDDGRFLGRVRCPARFTLIDADGDTVWGTVLDENDLTAVVRYRIEPGLR